MKKQYGFMIVGMAILSIIASFLAPSFLSFSNAMTIARQASILLVLSLGLTTVVLTGNIDLSVGSQAALTGCICAKLMVSGFPILLAILVSLMVGILIGMMNGLLVGWLELPPFVATYGMNMVASGIALMVMNGGIIYDLPDSFTWLGIGYIGIVPFPVFFSLFMTVLFTILLRKTTWGRNIYMIGLNKLAATYSAVDTLKHLLGTYMLSGFMASVGGILMTARLNAADAGMCDAYGLQIVAAVVVGGTSLLGGKGGAEGTLLGSLILSMILNIMNMNGVDSNWQNLVLGVIILLIVWMNLKITHLNK